MRSRVLSAALTITGLVLLVFSATLLGNHELGHGQLGRALSSAPLPPSLMPGPSPTTALTVTPGAVTVRAVPKAAPVKPGVPVELIVSSHHVAAPVSGHALNTDGSVFVPPDPRDVSWSSQDAAPGDPYGTVILVGHVNFAGYGPGALSDLSDYRPGQIITLVLAGGRRLSYAVAAAPIEVAKDQLGPRRAELFDQSSAFGLPGRPRTGRLLLLTCGGKFDNRTGHFLSNVLVFALPT
jgi:hypothetical protein